MNHTRLITEMKIMKMTDLNMLKQEFCTPSEDVPRVKIFKEMKYLELMTDAFITDYLADRDVLDLTTYPQLMELYRRIKDSNRSRIILSELSNFIRDYNRGV